MRVRFGELSETEQAARAACCEKALEAWLRLGAGDARAAARLFERIDERIALCCERGEPEAPPCAALVASESSAWPLAELLLAQAPPDIGYALSLGRAPLPLASALREVKAQSGVDLERAWLRAGFARGHLLEITLGVPGGTGAEIEQIAAENLVAALLGDRLFETWIGAVRAEPAPRVGSLRVLDAHAPRRELQVTELFESVRAGVRGALQGLPLQSRAALAEHDPEQLAARADWTLLEVEPLPGAQGERKQDLLLTSSCTPELLRCFLEELPCSSRRFSRAGEHFLFLSYADDLPSSGARLARRSELEVALAVTLKGVGALTGVGLGLRTSYLDFALSDLELGLARVLPRLRELDVPRRSFIQFFDSELSEEWLSIWPGSRLTAG